MLSQNAVESLQNIFMDEYGIHLTRDEAQAIGLKVVRYVYAMEIKKRTRTMQEKE